MFDFVEKRISKLDTYMQWNCKQCSGIAKYYTVAQLVLGAFGFKRYS